MPVSSLSSRNAAASVVSPMSTKPPGSANCPWKGWFFRRIKRTPPVSSKTTASAAIKGVSGFIDVELSQSRRGRRWRDAVLMRGGEDRCGGGDEADLVCAGYREGRGNERDHHQDRGTGRRVVA